MQEPGPWNGDKVAHHLEIRRSLKFDRADEATHSSGLEPFLHQPQQSFRVAHDIRKQPIDRSHRPRVKRESALALIRNTREIGYARIERGLVDAENARAELLKDPCPTAGTRAEIDAQLAQLGPLGDEREQFPELEISTARCRAVLDETRFAVRERT